MKQPYGTEAGTGSQLQGCTEHVEAFTQRERGLPGYLSPQCLIKQLLSPCGMVKTAYTTGVTMELSHTLSEAGVIALGNHNYTVHFVCQMYLNWTRKVYGDGLVRHLKEDI